MKFVPLEIEGSWIIKSPVIEDNRGFLREWFSWESMQENTGEIFTVKQANISCSQKGTLRGIHYSLAKQGQAKLITCVTGAIRDFVVDIRPNSKTYGTYVAIDLNSTSGESVFIESGLGHAFLSLEHGTTVAYLLSSEYSPAMEYTVNALDPEIALDFSIEMSDLIMSERDRSAPSLSFRHQEGNLPMSRG